MAIDAWLPNGFLLPDRAKIVRAGFAGENWQIYGTAGAGQALVVRTELADRWLSSGLVQAEDFHVFKFGRHDYHTLSSGRDHTLRSIDEARSPDSKAEALAFALALAATREIDPISPLQDAIYVEKISRLLPTYSISSRTDDDVVLGYWLTGGASISAKSFRRLGQTLSWLGVEHLRDIVQAAGFDVETVLPRQRESVPQAQHLEPSAALAPGDAARTAPEKSSIFELAGRPELAAFFNEHVVDIVVNRDRYKALGIDFPSAVILHGPPGCGKTFAVERLVDFLGWPCFQIDASSVASPYIHDTSRKVAQVFEKAMESAPSVLVIDEMEAFLADRDMGAGSSHHRVEEVAEFLRRIPEAVKNEVLVLAMTNRIDMVDPAIQRRGRFDHVIKVDFASEVEVRSLLDKLLSALPKDPDVSSNELAPQLAGRPLSDVTFVVREGARLAARSGRDRLDQASLRAAMKTTPVRGREETGAKRRIGFV